MKSCITVVSVLLLLLAVLSPLAHAQDGLIWIEGESANKQNVTKHSWYSSVQKSQLSGNDFLSHFNDDKGAEATYLFDVETAGTYEFWIRANPIQSKLSYTLNGGKEIDIDLTKSKRDEINIASDNKPDLRFLAWIKVGNVTLTSKTNTLTFQFDSEKHHHGYLDCFLLSSKPILPRGAQRPTANKLENNTTGEWYPFEPGLDSFDTNSVIDLRFLNEQVAGENGWIIARDGKFVHEKTGEAVRFWGVNGPPEDVHGEDLAYTARLLAKYGVNLVRIHGAVFDKNGEVDLSKIEHIHEIVAAMKKEGIYCHLSIYFPLWFRPSANLEWLPGYDGQKNPFATLFFNEKFQAKHREWIRALLTTADKKSGATLLQEPAVFGLEIQNEDSLFFWTFSEANIPEPQLQIMEEKFATWCKNKYGSLEDALKSWKAQSLKGDDIRNGRIAFRPMWNMFNDRSLRDQDTATFLYETQASFYRNTTRYIKDLGFKGLVHGSNWTTASPERLTPLEKLSYLEGDFVDRHGYFGGVHKGDNSAWSIRPGHQFGHRSALRFDPMNVGKPRLFVHPVMDPQYADKPSMISETTFTRPNRYRSEAPLYYAAYGSLQDSDAIVHFAFDGMQWEVKPRFWTQPWTLATPSMMGQFPVAAMLYRRGYVSTGDVMATINLNIERTKQLDGTPLPQDAALDELRTQDLPQGTSVATGERIDPLIHYTGRTVVNFSEDPTKVDMRNLTKLISRDRKSIRSSTGEIELNYDVGLLQIRTPKVLAVSGALKSQPQIDLGLIKVTSGLELGHIAVLSLDNQPLEDSKKILLQVMTEEQPSEFKTTSLANQLLQINELGKDPWQFRKIEGRIQLSRTDAKKLSVFPLDLQGKPREAIGSAEQFELLPNVVYYLISAGD